METEAQKTTPILNIAWTRIAQLDASAKEGTRSYISVRRWIATLGILAIVFAILSQTFPSSLSNVDTSSTVSEAPTVSETPALLGLTIRILLVTIPIVASALSIGFSNRDWQITRGGAEEIQKEIYYYRTIRKSNPGRYHILRRRLAEIQKQISRSLKSEFSLAPYKGPIPPNYNPQDPYSDPGFTDLTGEEYVKYRLEHQLMWHNKRLNQFKSERIRLQLFIIICGAAGALLAAFDYTTIWVALTVSLTTALISWQELRNLDSIIPYYSKVVTDLTLLFDRWQNLELEERTGKEFYKTVIACEKLLWAGNIEYTRMIQDVTTDMDTEEEFNFIEDEIDRYDKTPKRIQ